MQIKLDGIARRLAVKHMCYGLTQSLKKDLCVLHHY